MLIMIRDNADISSKTKYVDTDGDIGLILGRCVDVDIGTFVIC